MFTRYLTEPEFFRGKKGPFFDNPGFQLPPYYLYRLNVSALRNNKHTSHLLTYSKAFPFKILVLCDMLTKPLKQSK